MPCRAPAFVDRLVGASSGLLGLVVHHVCVYLKRYLLILLVLRLAPLASAQDKLHLNDAIRNCTSNTDIFLGDAQSKFLMMDWLRRGLCIRSGAGYGNNAELKYICYSRLQNVLQNNLNEICDEEHTHWA